MISYTENLTVPTDAFKRASGAFDWANAYAACSDGFFTVECSASLNGIAVGAGTTVVCEVGGGLATPITAFGCVGLGTYGGWATSKAIKAVGDFFGLK